MVVLRMRFPKRFQEVLAAEVRFPQGVQMAPLRMRMRKCWLQTISGFEPQHSDGLSYGGSIRMAY